VLLQSSLSPIEYIRVNDRLHSLAQAVRMSPRGYTGSALGSWSVSGFYHPIAGIDADTELSFQGVDVSVDTMSEADLLVGYTEPEQRRLKSMGYIDDRQEYTAVLGLFPPQRILCSIAYPGATEIRLLGYVVLHLASMLSGLVDCDGDPTFPAMDPARVDFDTEPRSLFAAPADLTAWRPTGPGRVFELHNTYQQDRTVLDLSSGKPAARLARWYRTIMDGAAFEHWLRTGLDDWLKTRVR
jgi:hypothetical protein